MAGSPNIGRRDDRTSSKFGNLQLVLKTKGVAQDPMKRCFSVKRGPNEGLDLKG